MDIKKICFNCGKGFDAVRRSAQYCSGSCRVISSRKRKVHEGTIMEEICARCMEKDRRIGLLEAHIKKLEMNAVGDNVVSYD